MLNEFLQNQAANYASGGMTAGEREPFELLLEYHDELREFVASLADVSASLSLATIPVQVPVGLKARITSAIASRPQRAVQDGIVISGADRLVEWVNPAFSNMCGYSLEELRGKNLGPILQGTGTDRATAERMRQAVRSYRPCREKILNYHKNGTPYWVEISISPILGESGEPLWLVARECELAACTSV